MSSTNKKNGSKAVDMKMTAKAETQTGAKSAAKEGWNDIESLFDSKKQEKRKAQADAKVEKAKQKKQRRNKPRKDASDSEDENWVNDGLGGVYNAEGYTGRVEDGVKVFKAHVLSKPNAGQTAQCPFDCDCCYI